LGELAEDLALEQIRRVHDVLGGAESIGEMAAPTGQTLSVMKSSTSATRMHFNQVPGMDGEGA
jgi:hypothetical protein